MITYSCKKLSNGIRLVTAPLKTSEAVTVLIVTGIGGRYETPEIAGISHFLEHMFFKGTKKRSALELRKEFDAMGANYNAFTGEEVTAFYVHSAANDFSESLDILSDLFLNPAFPEEEFEREKGVIVEEANMRRDIPQLHVQVLSQNQTFADYSLGHDIIGTPESIKNTTREDIRNYFKKGYSPESTVVVVCGNPKNFNWEKEAERVFLKMPKIAVPIHQPLSKKSIEKAVVQEARKVDQTHFVISALTVAKSDPRRYAMSLFSTILGGGTSSRLFNEIREKRGWAYYIGSEAAAYRDTGTLTISAGVKKDKLEESVKIILEQIKDLAKVGPEKEELERAKTNLRGQLSLSLEDTQEIASFLADEIFYQNKIRQPEVIVENLFKVTKEDIQNISKMILQPAKMGLAVIGPEEYKVSLR